ncbi:MAG: hypothetical protein HY053_02605 [Proteobacteria bacterium]|nr:hypothetical protein [Pseudomonadota bacterium]
MDPVVFNTTIQGILNEYYAKQAALKASSEEAPSNPDAWNQPAPRPSQIRSFRQDSIDIANDAPQTARSIGTLTGGKSRLNLFSALTTNDHVDFFNFKVATSGNVGMAVTTDEGVHVQILKSNGTVIADSEATFGDKHDNYQKLLSTDLPLDSGNYLMKVTRSTGAANNARPNYAIQLSMGTYITEDYETVEVPQASASATLTSVLTQNTAGLSSVLNSLAGGNLFDFLI